MDGLMDDILYLNLRYINQSKLIAYIQSPTNIEYASIYMLCGVYEKNVEKFWKKRFKNLHTFNLHYGTVTY